MIWLLAAALPCQASICFRRGQLGAQVVENSLCHLPVMSGVIVIVSSVGQSL